MLNKYRAAVLAALGLALSTTLAQAQDLQFMLHNESGQTLTELYVAPSHSDDWGEDILGVDTLASGESGTVTIADGEKVCSYDLRFVAKSGDTLEEEGIDLCKLESYTLKK